jgi:hypothetical protein
VDIDIYDAATDTWTSKALSRRRTYLVAVAAGGKMLIGYGKTQNDIYPDVLDVYDAVEGWSTVSIPNPRYGVGAAAVGSKAFFAGGGTDRDKTRVRQVDIYDTASGTWSLGEELSVGRWEPAGASVGSKVLFAGGANFEEGRGETLAAVDIIDTVTNGKTIAALSIGRKAMAVATVGSLVVFAGGRIITVDQVHSESDRVDVYDASDGSWSTASLSMARSWAAAVTVGHAVYVGGGLGADGATLDVIEVFDAVSRTWSVATSTLSRARAVLVGVGVGGKALFAGGVPAVTDLVNPRYVDSTVDTVDILSFDLSNTCVSCEAGKYMQLPGLSGLSTAGLKRAASRSAAAALGTEAFFAGIVCEITV